MQTFRTRVCRLPAKGSRGTRLEHWRLHDRRCTSFRRPRCRKEKESGHSSSLCVSPSRDCNLISLALALSLSLSLSLSVSLCRSLDLGISHSLSISISVSRSLSLSLSLYLPPRLPPRLRPHISICAHTHMYVHVRVCSCKSAGVIYVSYICICNYTCRCVYVQVCCVYACMHACL